MKIRWNYSEILTNNKYNKPNKIKEKTKNEIEEWQNKVVYVLELQNFNLICIFVVII